MSNDSDKSSPETSAANSFDTSHSFNPPRKRSKVSRACDSCRRKKIRCDADYSSSLQKVTKICTNCTKNNETCTFSRIPLKRGPSKGYIKDLEEKLEITQSLSTKPRAKSFSFDNVIHHPIPPPGGYQHPAPVPAPPSSIAPPLNHSKAESTPSSGSFPHTLPFPSSISITPSNVPTSIHKNSISSNNSNSPNSTSRSPIILPPLLSFSNGNGSSSSPLNAGKNLQQKINIPSHTSKAFSVSGALSNPSSPRNSSHLNGILNHENAAANEKLVNKTSTPPIQGPFWKVPYEMPGNNSKTAPTVNGSFSSSSPKLSPDFNSAGFPGNQNSLSNTRRSSIDSLSSNSTSGSRLPSLKPSMSINSDNGVSDSEEDFYSVRSHRNSSTQSLSPRNSISSLTSLSGRMNKNLSLNPTTNNNSTNSYHSYQYQHLPTYLVFQLQQQQLQQQPIAQYPPQIPPQQSSFSFPPNNQPFQPPQQQQQQPFPFQIQSHHQPLQLHQHSLSQIESNLKIYYSKFHSSFPILPYNDTALLKTIDCLLAEEDSKKFIEYFNLSLASLINYQAPNNLSNNIQLFNYLLSFYPFNQFNIKLNDNILILFFSSILLINYSVLLNGDIYSLGISISVSIFNDFKVLENFHELVLNAYERNDLKERELFNDIENIKIYLPKLYYGLFIIDHCYTLSFGIQSLINNDNFNLLYAHVDKFTKPSGGYINFKIGVIINELINTRNKFVIKDTDENSIVIPSLSNSSTLSGLINDNTSSFSKFFYTLIKDKYELINYLLEINSLLRTLNLNDDESLEILHDYQLKLGRLIKKLSSSIINLSNFISTVKSSTSSTPGSPNSDVSHELINPFLNIGYGQCYKLIKLCKLIIDSIIANLKDTELINRSIKINNDLSIAYNLLNSNLTNDNKLVGNCGLGSISVTLIKNKLNYYNLSFHINSNTSTPNSGTNYKINDWKLDFINTIVPFINRENIDGWY